MGAKIPDVKGKGNGVTAVDNSPAVKIKQGLKKEGWEKKKKKDNSVLAGSLFKGQGKKKKKKEKKRKKKKKVRKKI